MNNELRVAYLELLRVAPKEKIHGFLEALDERVGNVVLEAEPSPKMILHGPLRTIFNNLGELLNVFSSVDKELDDFDFSEDCVFSTREGLRQTLLDQRLCDHDFKEVGLSQGEIITGKRCSICAFQIFS